MSDQTATDETVTTEWVVHIQGMDDILPALGRLDAHQRAQKANADILAWEQVRPPSDLDIFRPMVWAVPLQRSDRPQTVTVAQVEADWAEWNR